MKTWNPERESYVQESTRQWREYNLSRGIERPCWNHSIDPMSIDPVEMLAEGDYTLGAYAEEQLFEEANNSIFAKTKKASKRFSYIYTSTGREKRFYK